MTTCRGMHLYQDRHRDKFSRYLLLQHWPDTPAVFNVSVDEWMHAWVPLVDNLTVPASQHLFVCSKICMLMVMDRVRVNVYVTV